MYAQFDTLPNLNTEKKDDRTVISGFSYPVFLSGEVHSNFNFKTKLAKDFSWKLEGNRDAYRLTDISRFSSKLIYEIYDKLYFFSGISSEFEFDQIENSMVQPRFISSSGVGYNFTKNLNIEAKYEHRLNTTTRTLYSLPSAFMLQLTFKF